MPRGTSWGSSWPQAPDRKKPGRQTPSFLSPSPGHKPADPSSWPPRRPAPARNSPPAAAAGLRLKQKHLRVIHAARPGEGQSFAERQVEVFQEHPAQPVKSGAAGLRDTIQGRPGPKTRKPLPLTGPWGGGRAHLMPRVLDNTCFLRQDLDEPLGLTLAEHHASDRGDQRLVGEAERAVGLRGPCTEGKGQGLTLGHQPPSSSHPRAAEASQSRGLCLAAQGLRAECSEHTLGSQLDSAQVLLKNSSGEGPQARQAEYSWAGGDVPLLFHHQGEQTWARHSFP